MSEFIKLTAAQVDALPKEGRNNSRLEAAPTDDPDVWIILANVLNDSDYSEQFKALEEKPREVFVEIAKTRETDAQKYETLASKLSREQPAEKE